MNIIADLHTHTIASTHAYSTVTENASAAEKRGLCVMGLSDHGPKSSDSPHVYYFVNLYRIPRKIGNVTILRGVEANIDIDGNIDMDKYPHILEKMDYVIASMHKSTIDTCYTMDDYTNAWLKVIKNPNVDILGHMGDPRYPFHLEKVIKAAAENNKVVEVNSSSPQSRPGSAQICKDIISMCKEYGVKIAINSDAHFWGMVGDFSSAISIVEEVEYPDEFIINSSVDNLKSYFNGRLNKPEIVF